MIDSELAFPDELPSATWQEIRVGTESGMVTVRRDAGEIVAIIWGNADAGLDQTWESITWAVAELTGGFVQTGGGEESAAEFRKIAELPPAFHAG
jgi:hypothetical protein